jgi:hypothetical protein
VMNLLTDPRITYLRISLDAEGMFGVTVTFCGIIYPRTGFETSGQAWRWACKQVYG